MRYKSPSQWEKVVDAGHDEMQADVLAWVKAHPEFFAEQTEENHGWELKQATAEHPLMQGSILLGFADIAVFFGKEDGSKLNIILEIKQDIGSANSVIRQCFALKNLAEKCSRVSSYSPVKSFNVFPVVRKYDKSLKNLRRLYENAILIWDGHSLSSYCGDEDAI